MIRPQLPERFRESLQAYFNDGRPTGGFLEAVLCNDLRESFGRADDTSVMELPGLVAWLWNYAPAGAWGSVDRVNNHLRTMSEKREAAEL